MNNSLQPRTASGRMHRSMGLIRLMRPRQWVKNIFTLAPLVFSGTFLDGTSVARALLATLLFCVASSARYVVNDMQDIERDRLHPKKSKTRPLAAGTVSVRTACFLLVFLYAILICAWFAMPRVLMVIAAYLALNLAYSLAIKHQPVLDIFTIAFGFVLRVYAGAVALAVPVSSWMFVTTLCLALYLAAVKRRQELMQSGTGSRKVLEKYSVSLVDRYAEMSATGSLVFYGMFVMSTKPQLVATVPIVLFGLFRYWYAVETLEGGESPTDTLLSDWPLLGTLMLWVAVCGWVLWPLPA